MPKLSVTHDNNVMKLKKKVDNYAKQFIY